MALRFSVLSILATLSLVSCKLGIPGGGNPGFFRCRPRGIVSSKSSLPSCQDPRRYQLTLEVYTDNLEADHNSIESSTECAWISGENFCLTGEAMIFGTKEAKASDPYGSDHPEAYRFTYYRVHRLDANGRIIMTKGSKDRFDEAVRAAITHCEQEESTDD